MIYYKFSDVIRELRNRLGLTQEELAAGICSVSTIAKIEAGSQMPSGRAAEALFRKVGDAGCFFTGFSKPEELETLCSWNRTVARAKQQRHGESLFEQQFYAYVRLLAHTPQEQSPEVMLLELLEIFVLSLPLEELYAESARRRTYTYLELYLMNSIAQQFYRTEHLDAAQQLLARVYRYLENEQLYGEVQKQLFPIINSNLAAVRLAQGAPAEARRMCAHAISYCLCIDCLLALPPLYGTLSDSCFAQREHASAQRAYAQMRAARDLLADQEAADAPVAQELMRRNLFRSF